MADVRLTGVEKAYGDIRILHGIDLEIRDGEFMVFVGPSGCGKSTLLRSIAGLEEITGGQLSIGGRVVNDVPPAERGIAMVFQNYALYPHMNLFDNMAFGLKLAKVPKAEIETAARAAAIHDRIMELPDGYDTHADYMRWVEADASARQDDQIVTSLSQEFSAGFTWFKKQND